MKYIIPILSFLVFLGLIVQPIHSSKINLALIVLAFVSIGWIVYGIRQHKVAVILAVLTLMIPFLPLVRQAKIDESVLRKMYVNELKSYHNVQYVWGGEGFMGIDCSGLPRSSFMVACIKYGYGNFNGRALIKAFSLWWRDASAREMLSGDSGRTIVGDRVFKINNMNEDVTEGDMAITVGGVHVLVYLSRNVVIQAEPDRGLVVIDEVPSANQWYDENVRLVRWNMDGG